jgi:hypothetical protein
MFLLQSLQAPFVFTLADDVGLPEYVVKVPRYKLGDSIEWAAVLSEKWRSAQTEGMNDVEKRDFNTMYPPYPLTLGDLKRAIASLEGAEEVIRATFPKAKVFKAVVAVKDQKKDGRTYKVRVVRPGEEVKDKNAEILARVMEGNGTGALHRVAWEIADLQDFSPEAPVEAQTKEEGGADAAEKTDPLLAVARQD